VKETNRNLKFGDIKVIQNFWQDEKINITRWHTTILKMIFKGKGDPQDPNNHQEKALKDIREGGRMKNSSHKCVSVKMCIYTDEQLN
jgi:hypothetical protein